MGLNNNPHQGNNTIFASVLADGKIHVASKEGAEGAVLREYETSDGQKGSKWELQYTELSGMIQAICFHEGEYGVNLHIIVGDDGAEKPVTLSLPVASNYSEDFMKKLPNIDRKLAVTLAPFSFENDKGKQQRGMSITQKNKKGETVKIVSHFYDTEKKTVTNGYPKPPAQKGTAKLKKSEWKKYFDGARDFLIEYVRENCDVVDSDVLEANRKAVAAEKF